MNSPASRPNMTSIAAACILSGGLIAAAIIDSHKPIGVTGSSHGSFVAESARSAPPLSQESVGTQVEAQLLTAPQLRTLSYRGGDCTLIAAKTTLVEYDPKIDQFSLTFDLTWKAESSMTASDPDSSVASHVWSGGTQIPPGTGYLTLSNDGYGHYFGSFDPDRNEQGTPYITITVR